MELNKEYMIQSYNNTSFSPEKRGEYDYKMYSEMLENDLKLLGENSGKYREKFITKVMDIYSSKMRQASWMIVGPANFKVTEKANRAERTKDDHFRHWRERYFKLVNRVRKALPSVDIDKHKLEIERLEALKTRYKAEGYGSRDWRISNTNANIRYYKKKIEALEAREELSNNFQETLIPNGKIYYSDNRLVVEHNEKPEREVIDVIKYHGFKYSPKTKTWVRQFTGNAVHSARQLAERLNK